MNTDGYKQEQSLKLKPKLIQATEQPNKVHLCFLRHLSKKG